MTITINLEMACRLILLLSLIVSTQACISCERLNLVPPKWSYNGSDVTSFPLMCNVTHPLCTVDFFDEILNYNVTSKAKCNLTRYCDVDVYISCGNPQYMIDFSATQDVNRLMLVSLHIEDCSVSYDDLNYLAQKITVIKLESVLNSGENRISPSLLSSRDLTKNLTEILLTFSSNVTQTIATESLLPVSTPIPSVAILVLHCVSNGTGCVQGQITYDVAQLRYMFPHLQSLAIQHVYPVNKSAPLNFPWDPHTKALPHGFNHSSYFKHLSYHVKDEQAVLRKILSISDNVGFEIDAVCPTPTGLLNEIVLYNLSIHHFPAWCFANTTGLRFIDISANPFTELPRDLFRGMTDLVSLYMRRTGLMSLPVGAFDDLISLDILGIDFNNITILEAGIFSNLKKLRILSMHHGSVQRIAHALENGTVGALPARSRSIQFVDFRWNELTEFAYDCYSFPSMMLCDFDHNNIRLTDITVLLRAFDPIYMGLAKPLAYYGQPADILHSNNMHEVLQSTISLQDNNITNLGFNLSWHPENIDKLAAILIYSRLNLETKDISKMLDCDCNLYQLKNFILNDLFKYVEPYIYHNTLLPDYSNFDSWKCKLHPILGRGNGSMSFLDVPDGHFICLDQTLTDKGLCPHGCRCYSHYNKPGFYITCESQGLHKLPPHIPIPDKGSPLVVSFAHNEISELPDCGQSGYDWLRSVTSLNIEYNPISNINQDGPLLSFVRCMEDVIELYLDHTAVLYLPKSIQNLSLKRISLPNRVLKCDCTTYWLKQWFQKNELLGNADLVNHTTIEGYRNLYCSEKDHPIIQLEVEDFTCSGVIAYLPAIFGIIACFAATILFMAAGFIYRFELKVILFEKFNWHPFDAQEHQEDKDYDVMLIYADADYVWVQRTLLVGLEQHGYRTADRRRDFIVSQCDAGQVADFLSRTHRVVVILSQNFLTDEEAMSDFLRAETHSKAYGSKRFLIVHGRQIIIFQDNIDFGEHEIFRRYINTNYFIPAKVMWFWPRLFYWIPSRITRAMPQPDANLPDFSEPSTSNDQRAQDGADLRDDDVLPLAP